MARDLRSYKDKELYFGCLGVLPPESSKYIPEEDGTGGSVFCDRREEGGVCLLEYQSQMKKEKAIEGIVSLTKLEGLLGTSSL